MCEFNYPGKDGCGYVIAEKDFKNIRNVTVEDDIVEVTYKDDSTEKYETESTEDAQYFASKLNNDMQQYNKEQQHQSDLFHNYNTEYK